VSVRPLVDLTFVARALAVTLAVADHLDGARRIDGDPDAVERPEPALLDKDSEAGSDAFARGELDTHFLERI